MMKGYGRLSVIGVAIFFAGNIFAQETVRDNSSPEEQTSNTPNTFSVIEPFEDGSLLSEEPLPSLNPITRFLPETYLGLQLGLTEAEIDQLLLTNDYFFYTGEPQVSFRAPDQEYVFDVVGRGYVDRALFQFKDMVLVSMDFYFNQTEIDYYSLHTTFSTKYGDPDIVHPQYMIWENENVRIRIGKEIRIQYIQKDNTPPPSNEEETLRVERFLNLF